MGSERERERERERESVRVGEERRSDDNSKEKYENAKQPQEKLTLIQQFIQNVYKGAEATQEEIDFFNSELEALKKEGWELQDTVQPGAKYERGMNVGRG